jgi:hypothetical protein
MANEMTVQAEALYGAGIRAARKVTQYEARIRELEGRVARLEAQVARLEAAHFDGFTFDWERSTIEDSEPESAYLDSADAAGLEWREAHWFGLDYAETLSRWYGEFQRAWPQIARLPHPAGKQQYDARFKRLWEYYLAYCETGFRAGWTDVGQLIIARPS